MANEEQLAILRQGVEVWNKWRARDPSNVHFRVLNADLADDEDYSPADLSGADLSSKDLSNANLIRADLSMADLSYTDLKGATLSGANMSGANLRNADLSEAFLQRTNFDEANLSRVRFGGAFAVNAKFNLANLRHAVLDRANFSQASFRWAKLMFSGGFLNPAMFRGADFRDADLHNAVLLNADLSEANFSGANLQNAHLEHAKVISADLSRADLRGAYLSGSDLSNANLEYAEIKEAYLDHTIMVETNLSKANLSGCRVYGISAWGLKLDDAIQEDLIITPENEPAVTVDNLEVAQFIYLMINNQKLKNLIDAITSKSVLILGRFTKERKKVLDAIRDLLRMHNYLPIIFDFDKPASRNLTETITLLARMSRFIIADLSDPKSLPQELTSIIPGLPSVPVQPIIVSNQEEYAMYEHWRHYPWVLEIHKYKSRDSFLGELAEKVVAPPEKWIEAQKSK